MLFLISFHVLFFTENVFFINKDTYLQPKIFFHLHTFGTKSLHNVEKIFAKYELFKSVHFNW